MDRTSIIILVISFALLMLWFPLVQKLYPPKPASPTNAQAAATGAVARATSAPPVLATNVAPTTPPVTALPVPAGTEEQTLTITNADARYTFSSFGGGIKQIELTGYPARTCVPRDSPAATNWAGLNTAAALPLLAVTGPNLAEDSLFKLSASGGVVRAEKRLTNGLVWIKTFEFTSNNLLKASVRLDNTSAAAITVPAQSWAAGSATPLEEKEPENVRGLYWYHGEAEHIDPSWFANRSFWSCLGMPSVPRPLYDAGAGNVRWVAVHNQFFALAVMPNEPALRVVAQPAFGPVASAAGWTNSATRPVGVQASLVYPEFTLPPNGNRERVFHIFAGPREYKTLQRISIAFNNNLDAIMGFGWFGFFAKLLLLSMNGLHAMGLSYAMAIIAITVIIKLLFWPLTQASTRSMKRMQTLQPQMRAIQEKFKDDPVKMNRKMMEFMKEHKVNPVGGCLPMLLQIPVFIGFYQMIQSAIELRGQRFLWVCDLSKPDTLFVIPGLAIPVNLLPLLMGATMLWQARLTPPAPGMDPMQQKIMRYMPLMFLVILYNFSAGLTLYWTVQNLLTIAQMKLTKTKEDDKSAPPGKPAATPAPKKKK